MVGKLPNLPGLGGTPREVANAVNHLINDPIALARLETIAADTLVGNGTAAAASPTALTMAQVAALLPLFTSSLNGLAPASGGGTTNYLRADGTWGVPPGTPTAVAWGSITGTLSAQTDLQTALDAKASLAGATFTGIVAFNSGAQFTGGTYMSGTALKLNDPTNATNAKFTFDGTTVTINKPTSITGNIAATNLSGTNTGDQTITLTGDVTGTGTGSFASTIGANKVTFSKFIAATAAGIVGATAAGNFAQLTAAQAKTVLAITASDVSGLAAVATSGSAADLSAGTLPAARMPALTGDVTTAAGAVATTIAANAVTFPKMVAAAAASIVGATAAGNHADLTPAQAKTVLAITTADVSGLPTLSSGTYTPTVTNATNLTANTPFACQWMRVGNSVTVSGRIDLQPTVTATQTRLDLSLPVSSNNFTSSSQSGGAAASITTAQTLGIFSVSASQTVRVQGISNGTANTAHAFTFTYQIL